MLTTTNQAQKFQKCELAQRSVT